MACNPGFGDCLKISFLQDFKMHLVLYIVLIFDVAVIRKYDTNGSKYTNRVLCMDITISAFSEFITYGHLQHFVD